MLHCRFVQLNVNDCLAKLAAASESSSPSTSRAGVGVTYPPYPNGGYAIPSVGGQNSVKSTNMAMMITAEGLQPSISSFPPRPAPLAHQSSIGIVSGNYWRQKSVELFCENIDAAFDFLPSVSRIHTSSEDIVTCLELI